MRVLKEAFPFITELDWLEKREQAWQLLLTEGEFKKNYRKKELEKVRKYFFEGEMLDDCPIKKYTGMWVQMFPVQTSEGYDYFYSNYEYSKEDLEDFNTKIFHDCSIYGMLPEDQLAYWDYHVGLEYQPTVKRRTPNGEIELVVDPNIYFYRLMMSTFDILMYRFEEYSNKYVDRLGYLFSIIRYFKEAEVVLDEDVLYIFRSKATSLVEHKFGKRLIKMGAVTEKHHQFCDDMVKHIDEFEDLPEKFMEIWCEIKNSSAQ